VITFNITLAEVAEKTGISAATLAGLRDGSLVAVPRGDLEMLLIAVTTSISRLTEMGGALIAQECKIAAVLTASEAPRDE